MRIFVALFDYDPPTMSPNPDACDEELPFREGQLIKVSHASRVSRVLRVTCAGVRREGRGRVLLGRGGAEAGLRPLQHGVRGPGGWRQCDSVTTCCSWLARCEGAGCDTRQAPGVAPPLNNPRTNHNQYSEAHCSCQLGDICCILRTLELSADNSNIHQPLHM